MTVRTDRREPVTDKPGGLDRRSVLATVPAVAAAAALTITVSAPAKASAAEPRGPECLADLAGQSPSREDR